MRIVVRGPATRDVREAQALLAAAGVEAVALPGARPPPGGEDLLIVPAMVGGLDQARDFARAARVGANAPLALLAGLRLSAPPACGLEADPDFTGAVALDAPAALLCAQIEALARAAVAADERARRAATGAALGAPSPAPLAPRRLKALYIGAPSPYFLKLENALASHGGELAAAFSSYSGFDHLHDDVFDAVALNGAQDPATALSLCAAMRRNANLHHLPTMVVAAAADAATAEAAIKRGASVIATVNDTGGPSIGWLFEAIRRTRARRADEHHLRAWRDLMGDPRTGLFKPAAFDAHIARMAQDHHCSGRPLALAVLRVLPAHGARQPSQTAWRRGFRETATLAGRLIRESDCGAAIGGDLIALALPGAELSGARRAAERVAAVAECTAFASSENGLGPLVFEQSAAELQAGESGAGLLARTLRALEIDVATA